MPKTAAGSSREVSRTVNEYVPYPRLRVRLTSAQVHPPAVFETRGRTAPLSPVQAFPGSGGSPPPPRLGGALRTRHSYPLNWRDFEGGELWPLTIATAATSPPRAGSGSVAVGG